MHIGWLLNVTQRCNNTDVIDIQKEKRRAQERRRYHLNPERFRQRNREKSRRVRDMVLLHYGGKCVCCGEAEPKFLAIDHKDNDGGKHRKTIKRQSGANFYRWVKKNSYPENLQVLCHNCNSAKSLYGACPHIDPTSQRKFGT